MAALVLALEIAREFLWDPLSQKEKEQVASRKGRRKVRRLPRRGPKRYLRRRDARSWLKPCSGGYTGRGRMIW